MNKIQIIGNLVRDPETRSVSGYNGDTQVCSFTVAANGRRRSNQNNQNGQQQDDTLFIRVSVWGTRADVCQRYLAKGNKVFVTGELQQPRTYQDQSGNTRVSLEMRADDFEAERRNVRIPRRARCAHRSEQRLYRRGVRRSALLTEGERHRITANRLIPSRSYLRPA